MKKVKSGNQPRRKEQSEIAYFRIKKALYIQEFKARQGQASKKKDEIVGCT